MKNSESKSDATVKKPLIMIFADYYLPGYKSGGGMRTIVNMVDRFQHKYDFRIVTRDHDGKLDLEQYKDVKIDAWNDVRGAKVYYLSRNSIRISKLRELILGVEPDSIYLNSFFATLAIYVLKLRKLKLVPFKNVVLAPCGELSDGALKLKSTKKNIFLNVAKLSRLYSDVIWKASTELEKNEIARLEPKRAEYFIAPDMPPKHIFERYEQNDKVKKVSGKAKFVFLSRFMRKKNFKWLLENFETFDGKLEIDIFGPLEDKEYWQECEAIISKLPENVSVRARGSIPHEEVLETLFQYHFFIMPTLGENFGHIFLEALACGCPLMISDTTPWTGLEESGVGWDLSLNNADVWNQEIQKCISMDQKEYEQLSRNARKYVVDWLAEDTIEQQTELVLQESLSYS